MALTEVFQNVCYYLNDGYLSKTAEINQLLRNGGGIRELFMNELVSHVITDQLLETSSDINDSTVVVHSDWVRWSAHCGTLLSCTPFLMNRPRLFTNLTICSSQLSHTDKQKLWAMVLYCGGKLQNRLDSSVTHLVCMQTKGAKYDHATRYGIPVVTADWILDCIEHETLLPTQDYHPSLLAYTEEETVGDEKNMEQEREKEDKIDKDEWEEEKLGEAEEVGRDEEKEKLGEAEEVDRDEVKEKLGEAEEVDRDEVKEKLGEAEEVDRDEVKEKLGEAEEVDRDEEKEKLGEVEEVDRDEEKEKLTEAEVVEEEECKKEDKMEMTNQPELLTETVQDENYQRKELLLEVVCDEDDDSKHQPMEVMEMSIEEKQGIAVEILHQEEQEKEFETTVVEREEKVINEEMAEIHTCKMEQEIKCTTNEEQDGTIVLETCDVEEVPTPSIPLQRLELRRKRSLSAVAQLAERENSEQPETPVECERKKRREELMDVTRRESAPKILSDLVLCLVDYPQLMDSQTMEKWKEVVSHYGGTLTQTYNQQCTHLVAQHKKSSVFAEAFSDSKCIASAHWLNDVLAEKKMFPPKTPLHFPIARLDSPPACENLTMSLTNYTSSERELVKEMARVVGIAYTGFLNKNTTHLICKRAGGRKYEKALEWGITIVNSSFLADIIHNGQVPAVLYSKHTVLDTEDEFHASCFEAFRLLKPWQTFMSSYSSTHPEWVDEEAVRTTFKGLFPVKLSESHHNDSIAEQSEVDPREEDNVPRVLLTGLSTSVVRKLKQILRSLGGDFTTDPTHSTHLVAPRIARTVKFLSAISVCKYIVSPDWLENSMQAGKFIAEDPYMLSDQEAEKMFEMSVATSLSRAQNKKLLEGMNVYSTTSVNPPPDSFRLIVGCAGGKLLTSKHDLTTQYGDELEKMQPNSNLIIISSPDDVAAGLCTEFYNRQITVYNAEFLLTGVLRQELDYSNNQISLEQ